MARFDDLPPEILRIIAQLIYLDHLPRSLFRCIDPHGLPSTYPDGRFISSTQNLTKSTLHSLCLTNASLYEAAKPLLWRRLQITLPFSFLLLLRSLGASRLAEAYEHLGGPEKILEDTGARDNEQGQDGEKAVELNERMSFNAMLAAVGLARVTGSAVYTDRTPGTLEGLSDDEKLELVWTEEPLLQGSGLTSRYQVTLRQDESEISDVHRYPRVLDFSTFTTQGMRRTVGQGEQARFVTPAKLLALITSVSHGLMAFGASPTMDSALTLEVLETLLFRDGEHLAAATSMGNASPHRTLRGVSMERSRERKGQERRRLESLDLCDCVSRHFEVALTRFVDKYLRKFSGRTTSTVPEEGSTEDEEEEDRRGRGRSRGRNNGSEGGSRPVTLSRSLSTRRHAPSIHPARATRFPSVERLCLHGVHFSSELLTPFVLAFPRLTHLDLTGTKIDDALLQGIMANPDMELESLSLARCSRITSECLTELLVDSTVCANLIELSLEGTLLFPTPIKSEDLKTILLMAPCMRSGALRYLDLSGCGMTNTLLDESFQRQPSLIDFGMCATPQVSLESLANFLLKKAPNVQVLELVDSCVDPRLGTHPTIVKLNTALLEPCATTPPLSISEQLAAMGYPSSREGSLESSLASRPSARTNLRVLGLSTSVLRQAGALGSWRVIMGKGRRGWLVDTSSGPDPNAVDDDLEAEERNEGGVGEASSSIFGNSGANRVIGLDTLSERRGRDSSRKIVGFEPETPPRRLSRSPSLHRSLSRQSRNTSLLKRATSSSHSRSRPIGSAMTLPRGEISSQTEPVHENIESSTLSAGESALTESEKPVERKAQVVRNLSKDHPRRKVLEDLSRANGHVAGTTGWHSKKMEVLLGLGMLGRENGSYAYSAYQA